jgi:hypothetical protein
MPVRRMLEGRNFSPDAAATLVKAFNEIVDELYLRSPAERERAAKIVIELAAGKATLHAETLRAKAVRLIKNQSADAGAGDLDQLVGLRGDTAAGAAAALKKTRASREGSGAGQIGALGRGRKNKARRQSKKHDQRHIVPID